MFCHKLPRRRHLRRRRLSAVANRRVVRVRASLLGQLQAASWEIHRRPHHSPAVIAGKLVRARARSLSK